MKRTSTLLACAAAGLLLLSACGGGSDPLAPGGGGQAPAAADTIRIASADFPENRLLAEIYAQSLEKAGVTVERDFGIGAREVYFPGLKDGSWDLVPDYTGVLLQYINPDATETEADAVYDALKAQAPAPLTVLERSAAENKDAVVVTAATAQQHGRSLADYGPVCGQLVFGGPPEFQTRPDGLPGIAETYGCTFKEFRALDTGGPVTVAALADGTVQAADLFTTDPAIEDNGFVVLDDPQNNFAAQNVVPLINSTKATPQVTDALNAVSAKLTTEGLIQLNRQLNAPDKPEVDTVAKGWLTANGL
ncbi:ABC transporter substrate-binding protein [Pseudonocardia adelaidensis]|uniref:ABC transporter substrate-binding protein n=1 Tax=Pseudonocardia adelaidensis TaxID=648754 RepID=A0ABP9NAN4_9PSEU